MTKPSTKRPTFIGCLAASIDGRIHPANTDNYTQLGSPWDIDHLKRQRDKVDAILIGAETFRQYPSEHRGFTKSPWVGIMTRGGDTLTDKVSPNAPLFHSKRSTVIFTETPPNNAQRPAYPANVFWDEATPERIIAAYTERDAHNVLCEGGGDVIAWLMRHQLLDELYLTVTPQFLGSGATPLVGVLSQPFEKLPHGTLLSEVCNHLPTGTERIQHWGISYSH